MGTSVIPARAAENFEVEELADVGGPDGEPCPDFEMGQKGTGTGSGAVQELCIRSTEALGRLSSPHHETDVVGRHGRGLFQERSDGGGHQWGCSVGRIVGRVESGHGAGLGLLRLTFVDVM